MNEVVANLQKLGLSQYESRAYVAALRHPHATAYELARDSGIPPSKIYEVVDRLQAKELLTAVEEQGHSRYAALRPEEATARYRRSYEEILDTVDEQLQRLSLPPDEKDVQVRNLSGFGELLSRAGTIASSAKEEIYVAAWPEELGPLEDDLRAAEERGVAVAICLYGRGTTPVGTVFCHETEALTVREGGDRRLILVADDQEAVLGHFPPGEGVSGQWSRNPGFVRMIKDYIRHDIWIIQVMERFEELITQGNPANRDLKELLDSDLPMIAARGPKAV